MPTEFISLKIAEIRAETADSVSLRFEVPDHLVEKLRFRPGQHLTLCSEIGGEEIRRNYSLCVAPHDGELRIAVKRIAGGVFSNWANESLKPGSTINVLPPHGSFTWTFDSEKAATYAGFAGGSGITPVLSLLKTGLKEQPKSRFVLFYGNRNSASIMFLEELAALKNRYMDRFQVYHFLEDEEEEDLDLFNGRLDAAKLVQIFGTLVDPALLDAAFICGPGPMMDAVEAGLLAAGVPAERILLERFTVGRPSAAIEAAQRELAGKAEGLKLQVILDGRRRTVVFDSSKGSILENARASGLPAPFACKAGVCATCKARLISGDVKMAANYGLSAEDLAQGYVLTCQAVPTSEDVVLDFD